MEQWIDRLARALELEPLSREEVGRLLGIARDVAHRVERKVTPVATFLAGAAVGRAVADGSSRADAMVAALAALQRALPPPSPDETGATR